MDLQELPYHHQLNLMMKMRLFLHINMTLAVPWRDRLPSTSKYTNQNAFNMLKNI